MWLGDPVQLPRSHAPEACPVCRERQTDQTFPVFPVREHKGYLISERKAQLPPILSLKIHSSAALRSPAEKRDPCRFFRTRLSQIRLATEIFFYLVLHINTSQDYCGNTLSLGFEIPGAGRGSRHHSRPSLPPSSEVCC